jgi:hypothetical protein
VTEINHAIGAEGIVSAQCKEVVTQYGDLIWDLLISGVGGFYITYFFTLYVRRVMLFTEFYCHVIQLVV